MISVLVILELPEKEFCLFCIGKIAETKRLLEVLYSYGILTAYFMRERYVIVDGWIIG